MGWSFTVNNLLVGGSKRSRPFQVWASCITGFVSITVLLYIRLLKEDLFSIRLPHLLHYFWFQRSSPKVQSLRNKFSSTQADVQLLTMERWLSKNVFLLLNKVYFYFIFRSPVRPFLIAFFTGDLTLSDGSVIHWEISKFNDCGTTSSCAIIFFKGGT